MNQRIKAFLGKQRFLLKEYLVHTFSKRNKVISKQDIRDSQSFCILPWIHLHVLPNSDVLPCCDSYYDDPYGNLKESSISNVWNNKKFKNMRKKFSQDKKVYGCRRCYETEESGIKSMRLRVNKDFEHYHKLVSDMDSSGGIENPKLKYFDMRLSNVCNFKCRGCSPVLSTSWYEDYERLWDLKLKTPKLENVLKNNLTVKEEISTLLPEVETIYFAGGEPLITDEHYEIITELIRIKKTEVNLDYNTNLSTLKFKKYNILEMWANFSKVKINISIDDIGARGEYFRSGLNWNKFLENFKILKEHRGNINTNVTCTISIFNIHRIPEIHTFLFENDLIRPDEFIFNTLLSPRVYRTQVLPSVKKRIVTRDLKNYLTQLNDRFPEINFDEFSASMRNQIDFMNDKDLSNSLQKFRTVTKKLDSMRSENFTQVYPELKTLFEES